MAQQDSENRGEPRDKVRLVGVYHANGGLLGELAYVVGKLAGTTQCSLCDITHGKVRMKPEFRACLEEWPITLVHLNEQGMRLAELTAGRTPCVVLDFNGDLKIILTRTDLENLGGQVDGFRQALSAALKANHV